MNRFLLSLILLTAFLGALVAQSSKPATLPRLAPSEAKDYVGKFVVVTGEVMQVRTTDRVTHINLGKPYPYHDFTAVVFASRSNLFPELDKLPGKVVEVSGRVEEYSGKPQIVLQAKTQLKIAATPAGGKAEPAVPKAGAAK
jgi:DNA/RNA endonuclease YhcR with UshA esterase domain